MKKFIIRRILISIPVLLIILILTFVLVKAAPGSPFAQDKSLSNETLIALNEEYGLDKPTYLQIIAYLSNVSKGYLGRSMHYSDWTVNEIIIGALPVSAKLGILSIAVALLIGVQIGAFAAIRRNTYVDHFSMAIAIFGISVPSFVLASLLVLVFSFYLKLFPSAGWGTLDALVLPVITLSAPFIAYISRITRASLIGVLSEDYVRTARAKGVGELRVLFVHALRNGLTPLISFLGPASAGILTGSVVVEKVYAIPGLGIHFVHSALHRDYFLAVGCALTYGLILLLCNMVSDILYVVTDPRTMQNGK